MVVLLLDDSLVGQSGCIFAAPLHGLTHAMRIPSPAVSRTRRGFFLSKLARFDNG